MRATIGLRVADKEIKVVMDMDKKKLQIAENAINECVTQD